MSRALLRGLPKKRYGPYIIYDENGELNLAFTQADKTKVLEKIKKRVEGQKKK